MGGSLVLSPIPECLGSISSPCPSDMWQWCALLAQIGLLHVGRSLSLSHAALESSSHILPFSSFSPTGEIITAEE